MIKEIRAQIGKRKEWIAGLLTARDAAPKKPQPSQSPDLANLLMKYISVQREKSRKYSQSWQRQHAANELKTVSPAVNYLAKHDISTVAELDASLSSVREKSDAIRAGMKAAEQRMKKPTAPSLPYGTWRAAISMQTCRREQRAFLSPNGKRSMPPSKRRMKRIMQS